MNNYAQFDRLEGQIAEIRSVAFSNGAIATELREEVYMLNRELKQLV